MHYITPEGERVTVVGAEGDNLLDLAHANNVELEGASAFVTAPLWAGL